MTLVDEPILNLEQAKRFFIAMGCNHFYEKVTVFSGHTSIVRSGLAQSWNNSGDVKRSNAEWQSFPRWSLKDWGSPTSA